MKIFSLLFSLFLVVSAMAENRIAVTHVPGSVGGTALCGDGKLLYLAGEGKLQIYDTSVPAKPRKISELKGLPKWESRQIVVHRGFAYLTARHRGVWILDVRNPEKPRIASDFDTAELATGIEASGDVLFVTLRVFGVQIFDISDPVKPKHLNLYRTFEAQSACCANGLLAVGDWGNSSVLLLDATDPAQPKQLSKIELDGFGDGVYIQGNILYASTGHNSRKGSLKERKGAGHGLEIFDISNPRSPVRLGGVKFPKFYALSGDFWMPRPAGTLLAAADTHNGLFLVDVSDKRNPRITGRAVLPEEKPGTADCVGGIVPGNGVVYLTGVKNGLFVAEVPESRPLPPQTGKLAVRTKSSAKEVPGFTRYECGGMVRRVRVSGNTVYAAASDAGLLVFLNTPQGLKEIQRITGNRIYDVDISGSLLVSAGHGFELTAYRILPDGMLKKLGSLRTWIPMQIIHLYEDGKIAAVSGGTGRVNFFDLSNPEKPVLKKYFAEKRILYTDAFPEQTLNGVLPISVHGMGLSWYQLNGTMAERLENNPSVQFHQLDGITVLKNRFLIPSKQNGYYLLAPEDFGKEGLRKEYRADVPILGLPMWDGGNRLFLSDSRNGIVSEFDASSPEHLKLIRKVDVHPGTAGRAALLNGRLVIPAGFSGFYLENSKQ